MSLSSPASAPRYEVADRPTLRLGDILLRWETILVLLLIGVVVFNASISPYFLDFYNLSDATFNFAEKGILALAMAFLIIIGEIDLSIAAIIAVASLAMGLAAQAGAPTPALIVIGLGVGVLCGAFNGALDRHDVAISRHRAGRARRSGADEISRELPGDRARLHLGSLTDPDFVCPVPRSRRSVRLRFASDDDRPAPLRHRLQHHGCALFRRSGQAYPLLASSWKS